MGETGEIDHDLGEFWREHAQFGVAGGAVVVAVAVGLKVLEGDGLAKVSVVLSLNSQHVGSVLDKVFARNGGVLGIFKVFVDEAAFDPFGFERFLDWH